jgi:hypothetical protein
MRETEIYKNKKKYPQKIVAYCQGVDMCLFFTSAL